ncbi:MAG: hypothetical protein D6731_18890 [Planctomycetota bacterium]|nr:MAG: hypothetical protein D6731_18890 [Planctomycetota bacterium]
MDVFDPPPFAPWRLALGLAGAGLVAWLTLALQRALAAARLRRRWARARGLEARAPRVLASAGYALVAAQVQRVLTLEVDGRPRTYAVRADGLARDRAGRLWVVEVKSGATAPDPLHAPTRRQLLEYRVGYGEAEGVLLVDMERERVHWVRFRIG